MLSVVGRERLRTHSIESSGKLKISPEQHWDFTAEDLKDLGEIGRGAYGSVNKMVHKPSNKIMAVKVPNKSLLFCSAHSAPVVNLHANVSGCALLRLCPADASRVFHTVTF